MNQKKGIELIYDDDCYLCRNSADALRLKKTVGPLRTINACTQDPLVQEAMNLGYDLNEGILVRYQDHFYYGHEALHLLALLSSSSDRLNSLNALLFRYKTSTRIIYPLMKLVRKALFLIRRTPKIQAHTTQPAFASVFGQDWITMPPILKRRYASYAFKEQQVTIAGTMNIEVSKFFSFMAPLLHLAGALVSYPGENVPTTVTCVSNKASPIIQMKRLFNYTNRKPCSFKSGFLITQKKEVIELMRFGLGVKMDYSFLKGSVHLKHNSYVWRVFNASIPLPFTYLLGKVSGEEKAISENEFSMFVKITHPLFGKVFEYNGRFKIQEDT